VAPTQGGTDEFFCGNPEFFCGFRIIIPDSLPLGDRAQSDDLLCIVGKLLTDFDNVLYGVRDRINQGPTTQILVAVQSMMWFVFFLSSLVFRDMTGL